MIDLQPIQPSILTVNQVSAETALVEYIKARNDKIKETKKNVEIAKNTKQSIVNKSKQLDESIKAVSEEIKKLKEERVIVTKKSPTSSANAYVWGNCTWYAKTQRPDIGAYWGNANMWAISAQRDGFEVSKTPKINAIGVSHEGIWGHVFIVSSVSSDKKFITIREMNYNGGIGIVHTRTIPAFGYDYIYSIV